jgi:hypothetical protein
VTGVVAPLPAAALHPLTPGSPVYAMLKVGAIGSIVALRFVLGRRSKEQEAEPERVEVAPPVSRSHPVSKKKKRRRRR